MGSIIKEKDEKPYYREIEHLKYENLYSFWKSNYGNPERKSGYYYKLRKLIYEIGLHGSILWTELVKCENKEPGKLPPFQTFRTCTSMYLVNELKALPDYWPLITTGKESFMAVSYLFPKRTVIGFPHPTGSRQFHKLYNQNNQLKKEYKLLIDSLLKKKGEATWINITGGR